MNTIMATETREFVRVIHKLCKGCDRTLSTTMFHTDRKSQDGMYTYCRQCQSVKSKEYKWKKKQASLDAREAAIIDRENAYLEAAIRNAEANGDDVDLPLKWVMIDEDTQVVINKGDQFIHDLTPAAEEARQEAEKNLKYAQTTIKELEREVARQKKELEALPIFQPAQPMNNIAMSDMLAEIEARLSPNGIDVPVAITIEYGRLLLKVT